MQEQSNDELTNRQNEKKNQKNIYVHKIKSLMRISQDSLIQDEKDISVALNKKNIKKTRSEIDKTAIKLEKNRESAKRARLRKKLYIKLLEKRVDRLKEAKEEGKRIQNQFIKFSQVISKKEKKGVAFQRQSEDMENYLSDDRHTDGYEKWLENKASQNKMDRLVEEIWQVSMCSSLRNIRELSSQISFEEILRAEEEKQMQFQGQELKDIMKEVLVETQKLHSLKSELFNNNESTKKSVQEVLSPESEMIKQEEPADIEEDNGERQMSISNFCAAYEKGREAQNIFINITEGERILIEGWSYLEQKLNEDSQ